MISWRKLQAGLGGKAKNTDDVISHTGNTTISQIKEELTASTTRAGIVRLATGTETSVGTSSSIAVTPDSLAASTYGEMIFGCLVEGGSTTLGTGDALNGNYFRIPSTCDGWNIVAVAAQVFTVGSTGTSSIQLRNVTDGTDVLSTKITIDSGEKDSLTAAVPAVIDTGLDDMAVGDQFTWDVDTVHSVTAPKGLYCEAIVRHP